MRTPTASQFFASTRPSGRSALRRRAAGTGPPPGSDPRLRAVRSAGRWACERRTLSTRRQNRASGTGIRPRAAFPPPSRCHTRSRHRPAPRDEFRPDLSASANPPFAARPRRLTAGRHPRIELALEPLQPIVEFRPIRRPRRTRWGGSDRSRPIRDLRSRSGGLVCGHCLTPLFIHSTPCRTERTGSRPFGSRMRSAWTRRRDATPKPAAP
jgi:hypothetical protein